MADKYVTRAQVFINGSEITDIKDVTEREVEVRKEIKLMNKTGTAELTRRFGLSLTYAIPKAGTEYDFASLSDATIVVEKDGGGRRRYSKSDCLKVGEVKYDQENEATRVIEFVAGDAKDE